jgi:predicted amidohydrolase
MNTCLNVAAAQWSIREGDFDYNAQKLKTMVENATELGVDLLLIPEMWSIGYDYHYFAKFASDLSEGAFRRLSNLAKEYQIALCGTSVKRSGHTFFNTMTFFDPDGELKFFYDKIHLFSPMGESDYFQSGNRVVVGEWKDWKIGMAICYDLRFPELFRKQVEQEVQLVLICAQWPLTRIKHWDLLLQARAVENQTFLIACNRIGANETYQFPGHSAIIAPNGEILAKADDHEEICTSKIKKKELFETRKKLPFLYDMRGASFYAKKFFNQD